MLGELGGARPARQIKRVARPVRARRRRLGARDGHAELEREVGEVEVGDAPRVAEPDGSPVPFEPRGRASQQREEPRGQAVLPPPALRVSHEALEPRRRRARGPRGGRDRVWIVGDERLEGAASVEEAQPPLVELEAVAGRRREEPQQHAAHGGVLLRQRDDRLLVAAPEVGGGAPERGRLDHLGDEAGGLRLRIQLGRLGEARELLGHARERRHPAERALDAQLVERGVGLERRARGAQLFGVGGQRLVRHGAGQRELEEAGLPVRLVGLERVHPLGVAGALEALARVLEAAHLEEGAAGLLPVRRQERGHRLAEAIGDRVEALLGVARLGLGAARLFAQLPEHVERVARVLGRVHQRPAGEAQRASARQADRAARLAAVEAEDRHHERLALGERLGAEPHHAALAQRRVAVRGGEGAVEGGVAERRAVLLCHERARAEQRRRRGPLHDSASSSTFRPA